MSNPYCSIPQFFNFYDLRTMGQLSNDLNSRNPDNTKLQFLLDVQSAELESYLSGRYTLPLAVVPLTLTKWVAATVIDRLFARRSDAPQKVKDDIEWAEKWMGLILNGTVQLTGVDRLNMPEIVATARNDGTSRFDGLTDFSPHGSKSSTSQGQ